jgi:hypothetical protein
MTFFKIRFHPCVRLVPYGCGFHSLHYLFNTGGDRWYTFICIRENQDTSLQLSFFVAINTESGSNGSGLERKGPLIREKPAWRNHARTSWSA